MELKVINTEKEYKERERKELHKRSCMAMCYLKAIENQNLKNTVYWGIRHIKEFTENSPQYPTALMYLIEKLTYKEFMNIFPIEKSYDGDKWECKDYFSTMDYLKDKNLDDVIGENAFDLIWKYHNEDVIEFGVEYMMFLSRERRKQTGKGIAEEICEENNVEMLSMYDIDGKKFLMDSNGKTVPVKRNTGLKVIK